MRVLTLPGVFKPRSDSWMLAAHVARAPLPTGARVLELCTGSGIAALRAAGLVPEVRERRRGPLGPLLAERVEEGLLPDGKFEEDVLVIAGLRPVG